MPQQVVQQLLAVKERHDSARATRQVVRMDRAGLIFPTGNRHNARRAVARAADLAGLNDGDRKPVGCHDLRHSFAYHCLAVLRLPVTQVSVLMGHARTTVTLDTYGGLADDGMADAGDVLAASFGN